MVLGMMSVVVVGFAAAAEAPQLNAYAQWKNGPPTGMDYFPIAVWLQQARNAPKYKAAGINLYVGLWEGPTEEQLAGLKAAGMPVICEFNAVGLARKDDKTIVGWMHGDEPDNAQLMGEDKATRQKRWGSPVPPGRVIGDYQRLREFDPFRPIFLNLGQGVANDEWRGRGNGSHPDDYLGYWKGCDIVSYDVYPVAGLNKPNSEDFLWYVPKGVDRLVKWSEGKKIIWNVIECTRIGSTKKATPQQVKAEVWMSLIHGSMGIMYFAHEFAPKFNEWALLDDPEMLPAVTAINKQITELAPVLNSPTLLDAGTAQTASVDVPIDLMVKRQGGATYVFAVGMRNGPTTGTFTVKDLPDKATAEVLGENRTIEVNSGKWPDDFKPYDVHLYKIK